MYLYLILIISFGSLISISEQSAITTLSNT